MKTPTSSPDKNAHSDEQSRNQHRDYDNKYHNRNPFPTDRDLIRPAVFVFVCGALVLAIVAIIFLIMR